MSRTSMFPQAPVEEADATAGRPVVGSYPDYPGAQRAVDFLSDDHFPVERTAIVGTDLRMVETVLGRLTRGRAAGAGAGAGAWFGLLIGLLLSLFAGGGASVLLLILSGVVYGALFGAVFGFAGHAMTGGRRDFASRSRIVAAHYDVVADPEVSEDAKNRLIKLGWRES
ncbi:general stress protein [Streptomyces sedi]|nr:general stress protein [Streptomyces sedi]